MGKYIVVSALVAFVIGLGGGYLLAPQQEIPAGMHTMPDGSQMSDAMADMTAGLEGKSGEEFDRAFIEEMVVHHEGAVAMARQVLEVSQREELKALARDIIEAQTREIEMMQGWLREWYGE